MIPTRRILMAAWTTAGLATMASVAAWTFAVPTIPTQGPEPIAGAPAMLPVDGQRPGQAIDDLRRRDPFRPDHQPTTARYDPYAPAVPVSAAPPPTARPAVALAGIAGPPWYAVIEGVPGREGGVLLAVGDSAGGVRLLRINSDTATVAGFDTTWVLTPRRPWH